ncbi:electron transport oxidoreductase, putative [Ixodes scapularis]|uniref:Electron transport oxidoreductase, putative n=1 Tax=Ixodes scapularis TaxID=6945 RepID=B7PHD0_IXOSC|nr:electron transport oxidoreductase, putative [Ixodes scapularis]|eukprot:XP_002402592.1 electron transport oxidoreductase, putative [Ixodes scapularis]
MLRASCRGSDEVRLLAEFGGLGLDYSYTVALFEELAAVNAGGVVTGILVQTDICTPALARYGSDELRKQFLTPSIAGDLIGCVGISEPHCGSDVASSRGLRALERLLDVLRRKTVTHGVFASQISRRRRSEGEKTWWSTEVRCGSPTAARRTGCVCWPTRVGTDPATGLSRSSACP